MVKAKDIGYFLLHPSEFKSILQWYEQQGRGGGDMKVANIKV